MNMIELQEKFVAEVLKGIRGNWASVHIHYERFLWNEVLLEKFTSEVMIDGKMCRFNISLDAIDCLVELQECKPIDQEDAWTWLKFELTNSGKYKFDFHYGVPPLCAEAIKSVNA